jgi:hypothetical protein
MQTAALIITGNTYPHRRELRAAGCLWSYDRRAYVARPAENIRALAERFELIIETGTVDPIELEPATGERLRQIRQARRERAADRLEARAEIRTRKAAQHRAKVEPYNDYAFWTEPLKPGHHSYNRHKNLRDRLARHMDQEAALSIEAAQLRQKAKQLRTGRAAIAGDADAARQERRDQADAVIAVGDTVDTCHYGRAVVLKVNRKTYTVRTASGWTTTHDKSFCRLIEKGTAADAAPARKFKKGDRVRVRRLAFTAAGVVIRVNPTSYTVEYEASWTQTGKAVDKFDESQLEAEA